MERKHSLAGRLEVTNGPDKRLIGPRLKAAAFLAAVIGALLSCCGESGSSHRTDAGVSVEFDCAVPFSSYQQDWSTRGGGMDRRGHVPQELPLDQGRLNLQWKRFFGERIEVEMEPVTVGGTVYIGIMNGKLYAMEADTGQDRWVFQANGPITDAPTVVSDEDGVMVYFGALDSNVYCIDDETGQQVWSRELDGPVMSTVSVHDRQVFVGTLKGRFYGMDARDGSEHWSFDAGGPISCTSAVGPGPECEPLVYFSTGNNTAYGVGMDGRIAWSNQMEGLFTKRTMAVYGRGVAIFQTRKAGHEYSEPMDDPPESLQGSRRSGEQVVSEWADYFMAYPRRRTLYYFEAATGADLWRPEVDKTLYAPLYIPYWGEYAPLVDQEGFAYFAASGSGGDHGLDHDERLFRINLATGEYTQLSEADGFKFRGDEVGRATLVAGRYYQTLSEDVGYYELSTGEANAEVFGNGFYSHRRPLELDELPDLVFGGMHKHFTRFGSSGPGGFGGANDAPSALIVAGDRAFLTAWGHLYALSAQPNAAPVKIYADLDPVQPMAGRLDPEGAKAMLGELVDLILNDGTRLYPASRLWHWASSGTYGSFWHEGEALWSLAAALDYLDEPLRGRLVNYLMQWVDETILDADSYRYEFACIDFDTDTIQDPCAREGIYEGWFWNNPNLTAERLYGLYKVAQKIPDSSLVTDNWSFIRDTMYGQLNQEGWDDEAGFYLWEEWRAGKFSPNVQMAAVHAVHEMASMVQDIPILQETEARYDRMLEARVKWGNHVRELYDQGILERQEYDEWEDWGFRQSVSPMPVEGYLDRDNDYRQVYFLGRDGDGVLVAEYEQNREVYPYRLVAFHPFIEEINPLIRDELLDPLEDYIRAVELINAWWYMGDYGHQVSVGNHEEESFSPLLAADMFQARAYILGQTFEELAPYLPWTFEDHGHRDLFRIQNLTALLSTVP